MPIHLPMPEKPITPAGASPGSLKAILDEAVTRYNVPEFALDDPVQFPRRFTDVRDVEIASLLCATIAWGNRKMIVRDCARLMDLMEGQPLRYLSEGAWQQLPDDTNIHRTFFTANLKRYLSGLRDIYARHGSLQEMARAGGVARAELPAWELARLINAAIARANDGCADSRCLPQNLDATALKRLNMALRWLVRDDGIVDIGCWDVIKPSQLFIPMDVHVARTARAMGLLSRNATDRKATLALTDALRALRPTDPVAYDFALFGLGIAGEAPTVESV